MISKIRQLDLDKIYQYLLLLLAFLLPLTVAGANLIIVIICLLWIFSGNYRFKYKQIIDNKLLLASISFFLLHCIGLLWTEDLKWGFHIVHKMWYFALLFPILFTLMKKEYISKIITAFLLAISLTEIFSYLIWFEVIEPFKNASIENPTPFMSHISYNPILTFAIYLVLHQIFFNKKITKFMFYIYCFFGLSMSINMFITGGRAGQVAFFVMISILIFQIFDKQKIKSLLAILIVVPAIFITAYQTSSFFHDRVNFAIDETINYSSNKNSSVGLRLNYAINSWNIIKNHPFIGVGTGDFPIEYTKINSINSPNTPNTTNPHNMYTLVLSQLGLLGLISMLSIFYYQIKISLNSSKKIVRNAGFTLPILFLVLMLSDSYLLGHYTTLMFIFFSSFLYKDFEKN